jgi:hypothetical protein
MATKICVAVRVRPLNENGLSNAAQIRIKALYLTTLCFWELIIAAAYPGLNSWTCVVWSQSKKDPSLAQISVIFCLDVHLIILPREWFCHFSIHCWCVRGVDSCLDGSARSACSLINCFRAYISVQMIIDLPAC